MTLPNSFTIGKRKISVPLTLVDKLVDWVNPAAGRDRFQSRLRMALLTGGGGYDSADKTRNANKKGGRREMDADGAILPDLTTLREESQNLSRNNPLASGALKTNVTKVVGSGLAVKSQINRQLLSMDDTQADAWERQAEFEFRLATETREIDAERNMPFSLMQGLVFLRVLEDGDLLVNMPRFARAGSPYKTKLQLIEAARICNPQFKQDTDRLIAGVKKDKYGAAVKYYVANKHPGNIRHAYLRTRKKGYSWQTLTAFAKSGAPLAIHLYDKTRPNQTRGIPYLSAVTELIKQLGRYTDAEVMAAVVTGMLTVFVHNETGNPQFSPAGSGDAPAGDTGQQVDADGMELGYGSVIGVPGNTKIETVDPTRPNTAFDPFFIAITRQIGMALELPFEVLIKHFTSSYSAARAALEDAWDYFLRRRHWLSTQFCQPVYEAVITEAIISGRLAAPGFFSDPLIKKAWLGTMWTGDAPNQLDPLKEINAAEKRVALRISTRAEERSRLLGGDLEAIQPQIIKEEQWIKDNDLDLVAGIDGVGDMVSLKERADTYGVGVRAGIITPQFDDEKSFREDLGIPVASSDVVAAWDADGGTRRPITLQSGDAFEAEQEEAANEDEEKEE